MIPIELDGLRLRPWRREDAPTLARHADNPRVASQLRDGFPSPYGVEDAERFIARAPESFLAMEVDGEPVGGIGFVPGADVERFSAELGYWLAEPYWGRGLTTRAVRGLTAAIFERTAIRRVFAVPFATNLASSRVLEKSGYVLEGRMRRSAYKAGRFLDQLLYATTEADPPEAPPRHALTILAVPELPAARAFYAAALGWPARVETPVYVELEHPDGGRLGLYDRAGFARNTGREAAAPPPEGTTTATELYLFTVDPERAIARARSAGARLLSPLGPRAWGDDAGYLLDPFGNVLVFALSRA